MCIYLEHEHETVLTPEAAKGVASVFSNIRFLSGGIEDHEVFTLDVDASRCIVRILKRP